jgi:hypothetical protein
MRYGVTYITNKIVDAEQLDLTLDEKLRVICPCCNYPLTFIHTLKESRFFRHPKRTKEQLIDPDYQCEQRVASLSLQAIRTYNKIIDRTNIQDFQRHFHKILAEVSAPNTDERRKLFKLASKVAFHKESAKLFSWIEDLIKTYSEEIRNQSPDNYTKFRKISSCLSTTEKFEKYFRLAIKDRNKELSDDEVYSLTADRISSLADGFTLRLASGLLSNEVAKKCGKEILIHYVELFGNVLKMLEHIDSAPMRYFVYTLSGFHLLAENAHNDESHPDHGSLECLVAEATAIKVLGNKEIESKKDINSLAFEIEKLVHNQNSPGLNGSNLLDFRESIGAFFSMHEPDEWLDALQRAKADLSNQNYEGKAGYIYIAFNKLENPEQVKHVKIGKAKDLAKREASYQTYSPEGFAFYSVESVLDRHKAERFVHSKLKKYRLKGSGGKEWFNLTLKEAEFLVEKYCNEYAKSEGYFEAINLVSNSKGFG